MELDKVFDIFEYFAVTDAFLEHTDYSDVYFRDWIDEENNTINFEMALPNFTKDEIEVKISDNFLVIKAEKKEEENKKYITNQFRKAFKKVFRLHKDIIKENYKMELVNGIFKLSFKLKQDENEKKLEFNE